SPHSLHDALPSWRWSGDDGTCVHHLVSGVAASVVARQARSRTGIGGGMTMAHDPTRSWPTGKGPDDTSIPGAAWLELLDGQAFPVVGAGVMVRDGGLWTPASSSNPLHTRDAALASLIGVLNAAKETNPDAASASMLALLRGMLATFGKETTLAAVKAAAESLAQEDFATETTLAALLSAVGNLATEATLSGVKSAVDTLAGTVADGAQKVTLTGRKTVEEEVLPRAIRTSGIHYKMVRVPDGAIAAVFMLYVHGRTGIFESGQGANLEIVTSGFVSLGALHGYGASTQKLATQFSIHQIF